MGAAHSKKEGSSLYGDGSWTPASMYSASQERFRMFDPTEKSTRDISGPLGPVNLYGEDGAADYYGNYDVPASGLVSEKSKTTLKTKVFGVVGRAGTAGLGKAVDALDTIGSSMTNLNKGSGFTSAATVKAHRIEILAFEVANTIAKGYGLKESLSKNSVKILKEEILCSYGVQRLVSADMKELLNIAATDKKKEFQLFAKEVVRFGNQCRDPQWHNLDRYFDNLDMERFVPRQNREEVEEEVQTLVSWAQQTGELYHEMNSLDRFEAEIRRQLQDEESYHNFSRGENLSALRNELKARGKTVKLLKKKSLWSKTFEEVMEKLVDAVYFLHSEIEGAFGKRGMIQYEKGYATKKGRIERLGPLGLALHYAFIIGQIDSLVSRPSSLPVDTRDNLYQSLPPSIKAALRHEIPTYKMGQELYILDIKDKLEKTLAWLLPIASNTTRAHHGFGWVGEWANTGSLDVSLSAQTQFPLVQTLHHADRAITEQCILELLVQLHYLVYLARDNVMEFKASLHPSPLQRVQQPMPLDLATSTSNSEAKNTQYHVLDDQEPELSALQTYAELDRRPSRSESLQILTKSDSHSSNRSLEDDSSSGGSHAHSVPILDFQLDRVKSLDIMDRVDDI